MEFTHQSVQNYSINLIHPGTAQSQIFAVLVSSGSHKLAKSQTRTIKNFNQKFCTNSYRVDHEFLVFITKSLFVHFFTNSSLVNHGCIPSNRLLLITLVQPIRSSLRYWPIEVPCPVATNVDSIDPANFISKRSGFPQGNIFRPYFFWLSLNDQCFLETRIL